MLLNEIQVFFVSLCVLALTYISFLFKFNMTSDDQIPSTLYTKFKKKRKVNI